MATPTPTLSATPTPTHTPLNFIGVTEPIKPVLPIVLIILVIIIPAAIYFMKYRKNGGEKASVTWSIK